MLPLLLFSSLGCASGTRLLLVLDPPYKGRYELVPDPSKKFVPGSVIRIRPVGGVAYVPDGFIKSSVTPGGGAGGSIEDWSLEAIEDPSGKRIAGPSAIDRTSISIQTYASSGKPVQFILQVK